MDETPAIRMPPRLWKLALELSILQDGSELQETCWTAGSTPIHRLFSLETSIRARLVLNVHTVLADPQKNGLNFRLRWL
jgi:hypothetical protein